MSQIPFTGQEDKEGNTIEGTRKRLLSPIEADHIMKGLTGSTAAIAMWGSNLFNGNRAAPEERNNIFYGSFVASEVPRGREDLFYDLKTRAETDMGTYKYLLTHGEKAEAKEWFDSHKGTIKAYGYTERMGSELSLINRNIRRIQDLPADKMSPEQKTAEINKMKNIKENALRDVIKFRQLAEQ